MISALDAMRRSVPAVWSGYPTVDLAVVGPRSFRFSCISLVQIALIIS